MKTYTIVGSGPYGTSRLLGKISAENEEVALRIFQGQNPECANHTIDYLNDDNGNPVALLCQHWDTGELRGFIYAVESKA
jgi:hypothetical protein